MIIKATKVKSIRHAGKLAAHLLRTDDNEIAQLRAIHGTARPGDLDASLKSMQRASELTRGKTGLLHVAINPRDHEADQMTPAQWARTLQAIEDEFGLAGQPCAIIEHRKNDRTHLHAVYQLTDTDKGKLIDVSNDWPRCQALGRQLEQEFSHAPTTSEPSRDGYSRDEQQQAKRLGQSVTERRAGLRDDYKQASDLAAFKELIAVKGYTLAQGDSAAVVLVDAQGEVFGLTRELGIKAKEARQFLGDMLHQLPTLDQVKTRPLLVAKPDQVAISPLGEGRDLDEAQELALAMIGHFRQSPPAVENSYNFTFSQPLQPAFEMNYGDLLVQQAARLDQLHFAYSDGLQKIKELQRGHYNPDEYNVEIERMAAVLEREQKDMQAQFVIERQAFLQDAPIVSNDQESVVDPVPEPTAPAADIVSDTQDRFGDVLAAFRAKNQQDKENDPLKEFRHDPTDDPLQALRYNPDDDQLKEFRDLGDEQTRRKSRGLGLA